MGGVSHHLPLPTPFYFQLGRTSLHIAILKEHEDMVDYIGKTFRQTLKIGDNVSEFRVFIHPRDPLRNVSLALRN